MFRLLVVAGVLAAAIASDAPAANAQPGPVATHRMILRHPGPAHWRHHRRVICVRRGPHRVCRVMWR